MNTPFRNWLLLYLFFALMQPVWAQKSPDYKKLGEKYYAQERWQDAAKYLAQYQALKPGDFAVLTKLGIAYYHLHQPALAKKYLEYVLSQNPGSTDEDLHLYYARYLHGIGEYERAINAYKAFLRAASEKHPLRGQIADNIRRCLNAPYISPDDNTALVENLGDQVNSEGDEFAPQASRNHTSRLYFSASRPNSTGGRRNSRGLEDTLGGHWCSDMYFSDLKPAGWSTTTALNSLLNTARHEVALGFSESGKVLYFFRSFDLFAGEVFADTAGKKDEYALSSPTFASPMQPEMGDCAPYFFNDTILLFASRRAGGFGGLDLYLTVKHDSLWSEPLNLGPEVNSAYDESTAFLAKDGRTLWFSSNHTRGMGGFDIYQSTFDGEKLAWGMAKNLGSPINSPNDDYWFRVSPDGKTAYFSSDRLEGMGGLDLYVAYFKEEQLAQLASSKPTLFSEIAPKAKMDEPQLIAIPVLQYDNDRDVLNPDNQRVMAAAAKAAARLPATQVIVTVHTDETGPAKFDLYYGIKRAEMAGKALENQGIDPKRIILRSAGAAFPVARNVLDAAPNPIGQKLNRRIEITLAQISGPLPIEVQLSRPSISELMAAAGGQRFESSDRGLSYKVEMATTRQIFNNDAIAMFNDLMIESKPGSGNYQYTAGWFKQCDKALVLKKELLAAGFQEANVVAYIDGIRVSKAEAVAMIKKHPDLANYVKQ